MSCRPLRPLVALALAGLVTAASAGPISFSFSGAVTSDPFGLSSLGALISGSFSFDSTAADAIALPGTGSYTSVGPGFDFSATVDGSFYSVAGSTTVNTANDIGVDQYGVIAVDGGLSLEIFLQDALQTALASDALPLSAPLLGAFGVREFRLFSDDAEFLGSIDALVCVAGCGTGGGRSVPEPGSLLLAAAAMLALRGCGRAGSLTRRPA